MTLRQRARRPHGKRGIVVPHDFRSYDILNPWRGHLVRQCRAMALFMIALTLKSAKKLKAARNIPAAFSDVIVCTVMAQEGRDQTQPVPPHRRVYATNDLAVAIAR